MELRHIRYFVTLAEELHFGRAAARVHIAQPSLSRQIRDLEAELGLRLFDRNRRRVSLTPAGAAFLDESRLLLARIEDAVTAARRAARGELGRLRIAYVPAAALGGLPEIVRSFRARLPGVEVQLEDMPPARQIEALHAGRVDVGFARGPVTDAELATEVVFEEPLLAALPSGHPLGRHRRLDVAMLAHEPFVVPARSRGAGFHDQVLALCVAAGFSPRVVQEGSQIDALHLVAAGCGVAIIPASLRAMRRAGIIYRALRQRPRTQIVMVSRRASPSPTLRELIAEVHRAGRKAR
ncbi:MAG TPA: LysR family transcriptional regulator [Haliangiales bacterium]|nr:LysR family transcriptional regulator [Haliangiales bacterium]